MVGVSKGMPPVKYFHSTKLFFLSVEFCGISLLQSLCKFGHPQFFGILLDFKQRCLFYFCLFSVVFGVRFYFYQALREEMVYRLEKQRCDMEAEISMQQRHMTQRESLINTNMTDLKSDLARMSQKVEYLMLYN